MSPPPEEYRYQAWVLEALAAHGARPRASTSPERLHDFVSDLYRYELRRLRAALLAGAFPKTEYFGRVVALRQRYRLLSLKPGQWLACPAPDDEPTALPPRSQSV